MKSIVLADHLHQSDLKPARLLEQYVEMLKADVAAYLSKDLKDVSCPACDCLDKTTAFNRFGLTYHECPGCGTLYISPRPGDEAILRFYREAPSRTFWSKQLTEVTRVQRGEKIIKPRMEWVSDSVAEHSPKASHWLDLHTSQLRYVEAMAGVKLAKKTITSPFFKIEKLPDTIQLETRSWWTMSGVEADVITVFELLDQSSDVRGLMAKVRETLKDGGLCFITAILASGFDVKELGAHAANIFPPDRLNAFSVKGLKSLLEANGFEFLEFSTPGVLDIDIVKKAIEHDPSVPVSPFIRDLVMNQSEDVRLAFQEFLQANLLSSYGRILVRKIN